ncbi:uncharacterized protein EV420DRAFT_1762899 [Desarmillaria tabescens]|uniref:Uncharacterized protein n=1 Tax=Armillaria tabescens TaxID=1929756 RepID=A0AA39N7Z4_ARMTA|nr:uncharacterized protein EV420DRAFT_1762899 [Desarmillaria tabescens]KAK0460703.1 hypothetical protein EV420DRAFT_1762899 [Desarmillaria tabescens]
MMNVLPTEVLAQIIEEAWALPLTPFGRLRMATSSQLVSKSFAWEFTRVFCTDVHVFSPSHLNHVICRMLQRDTVAFRSIDSSSFMPSEFCVSITFVLEVDPYGTNPVTHPASKDIHDLMSVLHQFFPKASRISMDYHNWWYNDASLARLQLPEQTTELELVYTHSTRYTQERLEKNVKLDVVPPYDLPGVKKLTIRGGNRLFDKQIAQACYNVRPC